MGSSVIIVHYQNIARSQITNTTIIIIKFAFKLIQIVLATKYHKIIKQPIAKAYML